MLFSLYWRTIVVIAVLILTFGFALPYFRILDLLTNSNYNPPLFWSCIACSFLLITLVHRNGSVYLVWGTALKLENTFWRKLNMVNVMFFLGLAVFALVIYGVSDKLIWSYYKLFGQPALLLAMPALYISKLLKSDSSKL